jgi:hypothetical protein
VARPGTIRVGDAARKVSRPTTPHSSAG